MSVHYDATDDNSEIFLFVNGVQQYKFKADKNKTVARKLNLGSISDNSNSHYSHTMNGNIYSFSVDYELPTINKIQKIHKYLMRKHNKQNELCSKVFIRIIFNKTCKCGSSTLGSGN